MRFEINYLKDLKFCENKLRFTRFLLRLREKKKRRKLTRDKTREVLIANSPM